MPIFSRQLFTFRGTWSFCWAVQRYFQSSIGAWTVGKAANVVKALAEMKLARPVVRSKPVVLRIEPCNTCMLRCPKCACGTGSDKRPKGMLAMEDLKYILDQTSDSAIMVRLDGMGEPTMHPRIFDMIRLIKSYGMSVTMSTNLQSSICDQADEFIDAGLDHLLVAVDGATQEIYEKYRVGGSLDQVIRRIEGLAARKKARRQRRPIIEVQFVDLGYNRHEIEAVRQLSRVWGVDRFVVTQADSMLKKIKSHLPNKPKRCYWLWFVLTVDWQLDYHSCTNAWSCPWPRLNMREVPIAAFWNHQCLQEARRYNCDRMSQWIANDKECKCNRCYEMLVAPMAGDYYCE
jgi:pyruvate-formate lyase-activating enzyme